MSAPNRAVFTNEAGSATTQAATLTVPADAEPAVTEQPTSQAVTSGATVTFTAAASGIPTPTVQWQLSSDGGASWSDIAAATSASYSFSAATSDNYDEYRAVFANAVGSTPTAAATLTVGLEATPNWSGYFATGATFSEVSGSWIVPALDCSSTVYGFSSEWVGLDGASDETVEQTGTAADCDAGTPTYSAWYEMVGDQAVDSGAAVTITPSSQYPVSAGDQMTASVSFGTGPEPWTLTIDDVTAHWAAPFSVSLAQFTYEGTPGRSSAEWIVESPEVCDESNDCFLGMLPDFAPVSFTDATAQAGGSPEPISSFSPTAVEITAQGSTTLLAAPGPLDATGDAFTDTWYASADALAAGPLEGADASHIVTFRTSLQDLPVPMRARGVG